MNAPARLGLMAATAAMFAGCAPVRTPGTEGLRADQMALVTIPSHPPVHDAHGRKAHVSVARIDGREYAIDRDTRFWLTPGRHEFAVFYLHCVHGPGTWFNPFAEGLGLGMPTGRAELDAEPGRRYVLEAWTTGAGSMALTRHRFRQVGDR